jgi:hypothetical protein
VKGLVTSVAYAAGAALEDNIFSQTLTRETTERIYQLKRDLLEVKRAVVPLVDMCNRLVRADVALIRDDARVYFRDVYDHANLGLAERGDEAPRGVGGDHRGADHDRGSLRHELQVHARARVVVGYPVTMTVMGAVCAFLYYRFKRRLALTGERPRFSSMTVARQSREPSE